MLSKDRILTELKQIQYPGFDQDIISFGVVKEVEIQKGNITVQLDLRTGDEGVRNQVVEKIRSLLGSLPEVTGVEIRMAAGPAESARPEQDNLLPGVKYKIAVASGKGGVGKSTVSVNLAVAMAKLGLRVGLLDSDIYGPSIPLMLGIHDRPQFTGEKLLPLEKYKVKLMSLGFLLTDDSPVIWRGPLVMRALQQLIGDVSWGELDVMLFDMPPGTGDAQLTLSQSITLDGAVIVSTPQDVALLDAVKGVQMFRKVNVPILGIIENMSYFICQSCNERTDIFSTGGARKECARLGVPLLGEIPLDIEIRQGGDEGIPIVEKKPDNTQAQAFMEIAEKLKAEHLGT